jgi:hypothetical protein
VTNNVRFIGPLIAHPGGAVPVRFGATGGPVDPVDPGLPPLPEPLAPGVIWAGLRAAWAGPTSAAGTARAAWGASTGVGAPARAVWGAARALGVPARAPWQHTTASPPAAVRAPWQYGQPIGAGTRAPWQHGQAVPAPSVRAPWGPAVRRAHTAAAPWGPAAGQRRSTRAPWAPAGRAHHGVSTWIGYSRQAVGPARAPWGPATPVWGLGTAVADVVTPPVIPHRCYIPRPGDQTEVRFEDALPRLLGLARLRFICRHAATVRVPVREVYMVTNNVTLARTDGTPVPCTSMRLSLDVDSWAWGFSAAVPPAALSLIEPTGPGEPIELVATVNGAPIRVLVESIQSERTFGQHALRIAGRGKSARLDGPYQAATAYSEPALRTSQQLLDGLLPVGWTADWQITPWLVPGGTWSHLGTAITAAQAIAQAAGAYLQPHDTANVLRVLPRWPTAPWLWSGVTPDVQLPAAVATRESLSWVDLPEYDGVVVSGTTSAGVQRLVKRLGSAGTTLAQAINDPLITHDDAARQRGIAALARTGRWLDVTLRLPVLPATGVLRPGKFVRYVDGGTTRLGIVRGVDVDVAMPTVWQSIRLETPA